jgi:hypothetical protein
MLRKFFGGPMLFWSPSSRGFNGYLKVDLKSVEYATANEAFDRFEASLERFLASCGNMADFEVKGKVGFMREGEYQWAQYGKLPIHHPGWNFPRLEEFQRTPTVSVRRLGRLCDVIEAQVPEDVLTRHREIKKARGDEPIREGDYFLVTPAIEKLLLEKHGESWPYKYFEGHADGEKVWLHDYYWRPGKVPLTDAELRAEEQAKAGIKPEDDPRSLCTWFHETFYRRGPRVVTQQDTPAEAPATPAIPAPATPSTTTRAFAGNVDVSDLVHEPDALLRNAEPQPVFPDASREPRPATTNARTKKLNAADIGHEPDSFKRQKEALFRYARYLKRVPTPDQALAFIRAQNLFTGPWEQHQERRRARVRDILNFIARTFEAGKCANGHVNVGKYDEWAKKKFPGGLVGGHRRYIDEEGNVVESCQYVHVGSKFIAVFLSIAEFSLFTDQNQDGSLPHDRAKELWDSLFAKGLVSVKFDARKWAVCRDGLERHGVVAVTDREYGPNKAMKWALGPYFPFLGLWKGKKRRSPLGPVDVAAILKKRTRKTTEQHNTFLHSQAAGTAVLDRWRRSRPPPLGVGVSSGV